jgi:hypothetical protein
MKFEELEGPFMLAKIFAEDTDDTIKIKELEESGVMSYIFSEAGAESMVANNDNYYATIGKLLEDEGLEVAPDYNDEPLVVEGFEVLDMGEESFGGRIKRWVSKGRRFVAKLMRKMMGWFCESNIVKDLRSQDSKLREKAVAAIYSAACKIFPRFCKIFGRAFQKLIAYVVKGLTTGILKTVCPGPNEAMVYGYEALI